MIILVPLLLLSLPAVEPVHRWGLIWPKMLFNLHPRVVKKAKVIAVTRRKLDECEQSSLVVRGQTVGWLAFYGDKREHQEHGGIISNRVLGLARNVEV